MSAEAIVTKEMGVIGRIIGVFASPKETFESIDRKPTWLVPFIIIVLVVIAMQFLVMDIGMRDQIAKMEARGTPQEQLDQIQKSMAGPTRYIQFGVIPIATLAIWAIIGGILLMGTNSIMGGSATFKKIFALEAWTSLIGVVGAALKTVLILSKGTSQGVATSLAILLPTPPIGETPSVVYRLLSKLDVFTIWSMFLWVIGLSVIGKITTNKSAILVISLWALWIIISVALGGVLGPMFGG
jgi:hypothetical protein